MTAPAWDETAEQIVAVAATMGTAVAELASIVDPLDFYKPTYGNVFGAAFDRYERGDKIDPLLIARDIDDRAVIEKLLAADLPVGAAGEHALRVARLATARRVQGLAVETLNAIAADEPVDEVLDKLTAGAGDIRLPLDGRVIDGLYTADAMLAAEFPQPPVLIPGLFRRMDRLMVVGIEGSGKSLLGKQIAAAASSALHPFYGVDTELEGPLSVLILDCENPEYAVREQLEMMRPYTPGAPLHILCRPGGLDIRTRRDRDLVHRVCEKVKPDIVIAGPLYKMARQDRQESDEQYAVAVQNVLDDLRVRWGFALFLEHHAPKGGAGGRDMVPFGSSAWMRWPEFGWKLIPWDPVKEKDAAEGLSLRIAGFRRDRVRINRPIRLDRGTISWPWIAVMPSRSDPGPSVPPPTHGARIEPPEGADWDPDEPF